MIRCKPKAKPENERPKTTQTPPVRQDTWTDKSTPFYDHRGNEIGRLNPPPNYGDRR